MRSSRQSRILPTFHLSVGALPMAPSDTSITKRKVVTPAGISASLRDTPRFEELRNPLVPTKLIAIKLAEVCTDYLQVFVSDREYRDIAESLRLRHRVVSKAKMRFRSDLTARAGLEAVARGAARGAMHADAAAGIRKSAHTLTIDPAGGLSLTVTRKDPAATRLKRDARTLNHLITDLCAVLHFTTRMSQAGIFATAIPPILESLRTSFPDDLPKRGLIDPEVRFKRFMGQALTALRTQDSTLTRSKLLRARARILFADDARFKSATGPSQV